MGVIDIHLCLSLQARPVREGDPSAPYRTVDCFDHLTTTPFEGCETVDDLFLRAVNLNRDQLCLGTREVLHEEDEIQPNGKIFKKVRIHCTSRAESFIPGRCREHGKQQGCDLLLHCLFQCILGDYHWETYDEIHTRVTNLGSGLQALGQKPKQNIMIYAETRAEWMISIQACLKYNFPGELMSC